MGMTQTLHRHRDTGFFFEFRGWGQTLHAFSAINGAGRDGVDQNALGSPFHGQGLGDHINASLSRAHMDLGHHGQPGLGGRDVDYPRARLL